MQMRLCASEWLKSRPDSSPGLEGCLHCTGASIRKAPEPDQCAEVPLLCWEAFPFTISQACRSWSQSLKPALCQDC